VVRKHRVIATATASLLGSAARMGSICTEHPSSPSRQRRRFVALLRPLLYPHRPPFSVRIPIPRWCGSRDATGIARVTGGGMIAGLIGEARGIGEGRRRTDGAAITPAPGIGDTADASCSGRCGSARSRRRIAPEEGRTGQAVTPLLHVHRVVFLLDGWSRIWAVAKAAASSIMSWPTAGITKR
jgi:hypothetical protein